ncbi:MAG: 4-phosphoerythronate dehydrogenase PdxB [Motiliproteus sp.]
MRIVADENIPLVDEFFADLGEVVRVPGRNMRPEIVKDANLLLVRSVTEVNQALLKGSAVEYVASATIGTDHIDLDYLRENHIGFANAPGCNADSVVDYVLSALLNLSAETGIAVEQRSIGIIGVGNVGSRLQERLQIMGCEVLLNDPPRAEHESANEYYSLDQLLQQCDTFCLHTPLTKAGAYPSYHLFGEARLAQLKSGSWLLNAGRGGAIDNQALSHLLDQRDDVKVVLDVWEAEPNIDTRLAQQVVWGTPHIAGYSMEGRSRGTEMIYQSVCDYLKRPAPQSLSGLLPEPSVSSLVLSAQADDVALRMANLVYDLREDHQRLQQMIKTSQMPGSDKILGQGFDQLRKTYPPRREFSSLTIAGLEADSRSAGQLKAMGFKVEF